MDEKKLFMVHYIYANVTNVLVRFAKKITTQQLFVHKQINRQVYVWMNEEMDVG